VLHFISIFRGIATLERCRIYRLAHPPKIVAVDGRTEFSFSLRPESYFSLSIPFALIFMRLPLRAFLRSFWDEV
jgi:hypothetical protein